MKLNTFENCMKAYKEIGSWDQEFNQEREELLKIYPYSIVVEGYYQEHDSALKWIKESFGDRKELWIDLWYSKIGYDYGFWEFFFKKKEDLEIFKNEVPKFYIIGPKGKWKSDGYENEIYIDVN